MNKIFFYLSICMPGLCPLRRGVAETRRQHTYIHLPHSLLISVPLNLKGREDQTLLCHTVWGQYAVVDKRLKRAVTEAYLKDQITLQ